MKKQSVNHTQQKTKPVYRFDQTVPSNTVKVVLANRCIDGTITHEQHLKIFEKIFDMGVKPRK